MEQHQVQSVPHALHLTKDTALSSVTGKRTKLQSSCPIARLNVRANAHPSGLCDSPSGCLFLR